MTSNLPHCKVIPLPDHQVSFEIDRSERLRWHFGPQYPRPCFYPFNGPSGSSLTRMGHPGAPDHDHHRSIWFAHHNVLGIDFWSDRTAAFIRQKTWLSYSNGDEEAVMAVLLEWRDGHDPKPLLEQELIALIRPGPHEETFVEFQSSFRPQAESIEFGKTNFGFLAVRVASNLSAHFGGGQLINASGAIGESTIFGRQARWVDYSGSVNDSETEGITYFDHAGNPGHPTRWHVREDGWMGASVCMDQPIETARQTPLVLRYLLHAHRGPIDPNRADDIAHRFFETPAQEVFPTPDIPHLQFDVRRMDEC